MGDRQDVWYYSDVIVSTMASHITSLTIVYSTVYSGEDQRKYPSSALLALCVQGIHQRLVNSLHKRPVTRKLFPLDDVIMAQGAWVIRLVSEVTRQPTVTEMSVWRVLRLMIYSLATLIFLLGIMPFSYLWFFLILNCLLSGLVPCPEDKSIVPGLTTRYIYY